ncbi:uncharacterized protein LOC122047525 isoform X2 [Zingiber officinale]|uniref:uncharacterized protein LOC122047525 isoform X2 n=1 Tax=Zingiber officinale TaxID=94328 RepID=UPI001C4BB133|nr:uncharacterized protein LOC122047525 isoform X2 [Zingiber officinale]
MASGNVDLPDDPSITKPVEEVWAGKGLVGEDDGDIDVEEGFGLRRISIRLSSTLSFSCSCMILEFGYYDMFVITLL